MLQTRAAASIGVETVSGLRGRSGHEDGAVSVGTEMPK